MQNLSLLFLAQVEWCHLLWGFNWSIQSWLTHCRHLWWHHGNQPRHVLCQHLIKFYQLSLVNRPKLSPVCQGQDVSQFVHLRQISWAHSMFELYTSDCALKVLQQGLLGCFFSQYWHLSMKLIYNQGQDSCKSCSFNHIIQLSEIGCLLWTFTLKSCISTSMQLPLASAWSLWTDLVPPAQRVLSYQHVLAVYPTKIQCKPGEPLDKSTPCQETTWGLHTPASIADCPLHLPCSGWFWSSHPTVTKLVLLFWVHHWCPICEHQTTELPDQLFLQTTPAPPQSHNP